MLQPLAEWEWNIFGKTKSQNHKIVTQVQLADTGKFSNV